MKDHEGRTIVSSEWGLKLLTAWGVSGLAGDCERSEVLRGVRSLSDVKIGVGPENFLTLIVPHPFSSGLPGTSYDDANADSDTLLLVPSSNSSLWRDDVSSITDKTLRSLDSDLRDWCVGGCEFLRETGEDDGGDAERAIGVGEVGRGEEEDEAI